MKITLEFGSKAPEPTTENRLIVQFVANRDGVNQVFYQTIRKDKLIGREEEVLKNVLQSLLDQETSQATQSVVEIKPEEVEALATLKVQKDGDKEIEKVSKE